jgi:hypothetical protein
VLVKKILSHILLYLLSNAIHNGKKGLKDPPLKEKNSSFADRAVYGPSLNRGPSCYSNKWFILNSKFLQLRMPERSHSHVLVQIQNTNNNGVFCSFIP